MEKSYDCFNPFSLSATHTPNFMPDQYYASDPSVSPLLLHNDMSTIDNHLDFQYQCSPWQVYNCEEPTTTVDVKSSNETNGNGDSTFTDPNLDEVCIRSDAAAPYTSLRPPTYPHHNIGNIITNESSQSATKCSSNNYSSMKTTPLRKGTSLYRETHINSERQRRKDMSNLFNTLHSLLPVRVNIKQDRCTIVSYVINYVGHLQTKLTELGKVKAELQSSVEKGRNEGLRSSQKTLFQWCHKSVHKYNQLEPGAPARRSSCTRFQQPLSVAIRYWGSMDMFITLSHPKLRGVWSNVLGLLEETFALDVQSVTLSTTSTLYLHSIYAKVIHSHRKLSTEELQLAILDFLHVHFKH